MENILLLGASGSIGSQTLDLLKNNDDFSLIGFSLGRRIEKIQGILSNFPNVQHICVQLKEDYKLLKKRYPKIKWYYGDKGLLEIIDRCNANKVVNALSGFSGMLPSYKTLSLGKTLLLANKESLVVAGSLLMNLVKQGKGKIIPIDSEHVAISKLLPKVSLDDVKKILITASGGAFRDLPIEELNNVTPQMALNHPTWNMGKKITIDCATMMNKGFEIIEACHLFNIGLDKIEILMHRESNVHSALLLKDGTYLADISKPDMHVPIKYALYEGKIDFDLVKANSLTELGDFHFGEFDSNRYPCVNLAISSFKSGGNKCAILNGANEEADYLFLEGKISFLDINKLIQTTLNQVDYVPSPSLEDLIISDFKAREVVRNLIKTEAML